MKTFKIPYKILFINVLIAFCVLASSCKKFVDVDAPNSKLASETTFINDNTLKSALAGLYSTFAITSRSDFQLGLTVTTGSSADEITTGDLEAFKPFSNHNILRNDGTTYSMWLSLYTVIYQCNSIIEGVNNSSGGISEAMKTEALGEAKFIRAFCYFYLVNLWGDVPLALTTSRDVNNGLSRSAKLTVYQQIIVDLNDAKVALLPDYSFTSGQRSRPNRYAAIAMLSRVYLYTQDWANAEANATTVINTTSLFNLLSTANLGGIFVKNNSEAIFQLNAPESGVSNDGYTYEGLNYAVNTSTVPQYQLTPELISAFEANDQRFTSWVGISNYAGGPYYYLSKFKNRIENTSATGEYVTYLRLAELYLIRAEARARQNNLTNAVNDINVIRGRANIGNTSASGQPAILLAIEQERRIELFGEYAHRWNDLRRTGRANIVLAQTPNWNANSALYPIPATEILNNKNLTQNPGY